MKIYQYEMIVACGEDDHKEKLNELGKKGYRVKNVHIVIGEANAYFTTLVEREIDPLDFSHANQQLLKRIDDEDSGN